MGFSVVPPKPDIKIAVRSMEIWTRRADAAIMHMDVPWALLLAGTSPEDALKRDGIDLERYYRSKNLKLVITIDVTNGLARESEAPALVEAKRSITESEIQRLYRDLRDFPFINALGLSSYPYLGGFREPERIPLEYYSRLNAARQLPLLIVEGGWPSGRASPSRFLSFFHCSQRSGSLIRICATSPPSQRGTASSHGV